MISDCIFNSINCHIYIYHVLHTSSHISCITYPICSMYVIFTYIWAIFGVNVSKYAIHGAYGYISLYKDIAPTGSETARWPGDRGKPLT